MGILDDVWHAIHHPDVSNYKVSFLLQDPCAGILKRAAQAAPGDLDGITGKDIPEVALPVAG